MYAFALWSKNFELVKTCTSCYRHTCSKNVCQGFANLHWLWKKLIHDKYVKVFPKFCKQLLLTRDGQLYPPFKMCVSLLFTKTPKFFSWRYASVQLIFYFKLDPIFAYHLNFKLAQQVFLCFSFMSGRIKYW